MIVRNNELRCVLCNLQFCTGIVHLAPGLAGGGPYCWATHCCACLRTLIKRVKPVKSNLAIKHLVRCVRCTGVSALAIHPVPGTVAQVFQPVQPPLLLPQPPPQVMSKSDELLKHRLRAIMLWKLDGLPCCNLLGYAVLNQMVTCLILSICSSWIQELNCHNVCAHKSALIPQDRFPSSGEHI